ncbi:MAG TPA: chemotaxis protein CheB [Gemmatimonadaceae bacterium]|nr:chemotaxis protein CheB [Gemmatimonadaceae bacterium]
MPLDERGAVRGVIVIGASWGGLNALSTIANALPADFPIPVVIVQHRSKDHESLLAPLLQDQTPLMVGEIEDKEEVCPGRIYLAPANYHTLVDGTQFSLSVDEPVRYSRPSIDVTFVSAADNWGGRTVGVVLTGANEDGAFGLRRIADRGGYALVQDPRTAEVRTMPQGALRAVPTARVLPLESIGPHLAAIGRRMHEGPPHAAASLLAQDLAVSADDSGGGGGGSDDPARGPARRARR